MAFEREDIQEPEYEYEDTRTFLEKVADGDEDDEFKCELKLDLYRVKLLCDFVGERDWDDHNVSDLVEWAIEELDKRINWTHELELKN